MVEPKTKATGSPVGVTPGNEHPRYGKVTQALANRHGKICWTLLRRP